MKYLQKVREKPWKKICSEEWKRAKGIINFTCSRPSFFWKKLRGHRHAEYSRNGHSISFKSSIRDLDLTDPEVEKNFRGTVRHEIAHIHTKGHGVDFMTNLERLGGLRYSGLKLKRNETKRLENSSGTGEGVRSPGADEHS